MNRAEAIAMARAGENRETAAIVVSDRDLQRILACWPMVPRSAVTEPQFPDEAAPEWEALWDGVAVDEAALADLAGLPLGRAPVAYKRARALRLIYPDGSIHQVARVVLQALIKSVVQPGGRK